MNAAQKEIIEQVRELLGEHFNSYVLTVEADSLDGESTDTGTYWGGGFNSAFGMAHRQVERMRIASEQSDDHDDGEEWKATA